MNVVRCVVMGAFPALAACGKTHPPGTSGGSASASRNGNPETTLRTMIPRVGGEYATLPSGTYRAYCLRLKAADGNWYGRAKVLGIDPQLIASRSDSSSRSGWPTEVEVALEAGNTVMEALQQNGVGADNEPR